ncbi:MAG: response regulator [Thermodesulfobacteriota bacterium]
MLTGYSVLILADDSQPYRNLGWVLAHKGCRVLRVESDATRWVALSLRKFDLILARINHEGGQELAFLQQVQGRHPQIKVILCSQVGETAFPLEAYQLEVDDYLLMPCRLVELWRRVLACLKRIPGKSGGLAAGNCHAPLNRGVFEKFQRVLHYIHYNLDSSKTALKPLINAPASGLDQKLLGKIHEVSARLELLQEMTEGFLQGLSRVNALPWAIPLRDSQPLFMHHG